MVEQATTTDNKKTKHVREERRISVTSLVDVPQLAEVENAFWQLGTQPALLQQVCRLPTPMDIYTSSRYRGLFIGPTICTCPPPPPKITFSPSYETQIFTAHHSFFLYYTFFSKIFPFYFSFCFSTGYLAPIEVIPQNSIGCYILSSIYVLLIGLLIHPYPNFTVFTNKIGSHDFFHGA
jgi:hypothetical protein